MGSNFQGLRPWNHLLGWGGSEMLYRGGGQKMASRGGRPAIYPPHAHLCDEVNYITEIPGQSLACDIAMNLQK